MNENSLVPQSDLGYQKSDLGYGQLFAIFWRRRFWFGSVFFGVLAVAVPLTLLKDPVYESNMQLLVEPNYSDKEAGIENEFTDSGVEIDYATQLQLMQSSGLIQKAVNQLSSTYPNLTVREINRSLELSQLENDQVATKIFQASYTGDNPQRTQNILQAIQEVYIEYNLEQQEQRLNEGLKFINNQLPKTRKDLASAEKELKQFRTTHDVIIPAEEASALAGALRSVTLDQEGLQAQIQEAQARYQSLQQQVGQSPSNALVSARLSESSRYQTLLNNLQEAEVELATQKSRFTEANPVMQDLLTRRNNLRQLLRQEVERVLGSIPDQFNSSEMALQKEGQLGETDIDLAQSLVQAQTELESLQARQRTLVETETELRTDLKQFPTLIEQYNTLQQEVEVKRNTLEQLLVARQELGVDLAKGGFKWQVVEPPLPGYQVGPNYRQNLFLGGVVALFLGGVAVFIREATDDAVRASNQFGAGTFELLGVTPKLPNPEMGRFRMKNAPTNASLFKIIEWLPFRESLDLIYKNIELASPGHIPQSLAVTSALSGEGKSTIALGLAHSATRLRRRVLLIDGDLRQPNLHELFDLPNDSGLSTFLAEETELVSHHLTMMGSEIDVVTAGPVPKDPVQLLSSPKLQELTSASDHYDLIIFDTPPVLGIVDAIQIACSCNSTVLVARLDYLTQTEFSQVSAQLRKLNVMGIVANGAQEVANWYLSKYSEQNYRLPSAQNSLRTN